MEHRLKNIGDLADSITTLSRAVLNLAKRMKEAEDFQVMVLEPRLEALEHRVEGTPAGDPFTVPLVADISRIEEQCRGWSMELSGQFEALDQHLHIVDTACLERLEQQRGKLLELEEDVQTIESFLAAEHVGSRLLTLEETVANLVTICEEQQKCLDWLSNQMVAVVDQSIKLARRQKWG